MKIISLIAFTLTLSTSCSELDTSHPRVATAESPLDFADTLHENLSAGRTDDWYPQYCANYTGLCLLYPGGSGSTISGLDYSLFYHGATLFFMNMGSVPVTLLNQSSFSSSNNRFALADGHDVVIAPGRYHALAAGAASQFYSVEDTTVPSVALPTSAPSRSIGTAFQPSTTRTVSGHWSVRVATTTTVLTGSQGRVELRSDSSNPPTTVRGRCAGGSSAGLTLDQVVECELSYLVPAGDYVVLASTNEAGTPTYTVTAVAEQSF